MKFKDIAEFALGHIEPDAQTLKMASLLLIDTLGVAAGAANMQAGVIARNHAARFMTSTQKRDSAHMLFDGREVSITARPLPWQHRSTIWMHMTGITRPRAYWMRCCPCPLRPWRTNP